MPRDWIQISVTALPGLAAVIALIFTSLTLRATNAQLQVAEQGQITDRYNAAITNLGSSSVDLRLGGIYALQRIMQDSPRDQPTVVAVLCAFIRDHANAAAAKSARRSGSPSTSLLPPTDVQAALKVVGTRDTARDGSATVVDLTYTDLSGTNLAFDNFSQADFTGAIFSGAYLARTNFTSAFFSGADLSGAIFKFGTDFSLADLRGANLSGTDLRYANISTALLLGANLSSANLSAMELTYASFIGVNLSDANFSGANLTHASFFDSNLRGANLTGANLTGANLSGADLAGVKGLRTGASRSPTSSSSA